MKNLVCLKPGKFAVGNRETLLKRNAIIRITRAGIRGTDICAPEGAQPYFKYPLVLGYELAGELVGFDCAPRFFSDEAVTCSSYY